MGRKNTHKLRIAVFKFSSCDGCQLSLLNCEEEILALAGAVDFAYFPEATRKPLSGHYDLALVEGSVTTPEEAERIQKLRRRCDVLVTIGACATAGGVQALKNFADVDEFIQSVYAHPEFISSLQDSTPIASHVAVDFELRGCPVSKHQLLEVIGAFLAGRRPQIENASVCMECKRAGQVCVMVAQGKACLGPVTHAGCGGLCPGYARGCFGCFGPQSSVNAASLNQRLAQLGQSEEQLVRVYSTFNAAAPAFEKVRHEHESKKSHD